MPAKSKAQQKAAGAALSAKRGDTKKSELKGASKSMYESIDEKELDKMASTNRQEKPAHASKHSPLVPGTAVNNTSRLRLHRHVLFVYRAPEYTPHQLGEEKNI